MCVCVCFCTHVSLPHDLHVLTSSHCFGWKTFQFWSS